MHGKRGDLEALSIHMIQTEIIRHKGYSQIVIIICRLAFYVYIYM